MAKKRTGKPPIKIDWGKVDKLLTIGCSGVQTAQALGMHEETLYRHVREEKNMTFSEYMRLKKESGKALIKAAQFDEAYNQRNVPMLIWWGKNYLGQSDKQQIELDITDIVTEI